MDYTEVYKLPLKFDDYCKFYIKTANNVTAFNVLIDVIENEKYKSIVQKMLDIINGESNLHVTNKLEYKNDIIYVDGYQVFLVRGWGHLTGCGALNLSPDKAIKIQDDFCDFIIKKLKGDI